MLEACQEQAPQRSVPAGCVGFCRLLCSTLTLCHVWKVGVGVCVLSGRARPLLGQGCTPRALEPEVGDCSVETGAMTDTYTYVLPKCYDIPHSATGA